jgi:hypothetical protein
VKRGKLPATLEESYVSIVRVGLAETRNFAEGYDTIFSKKKAAAKPAAAKPAKKTAAPKAAKADSAKKKKKTAKKK